MKTKTTKQKAPNEAERTPAELQGSRIVLAKIRCDLMADPGDQSEVLTLENTRDVMRVHYEEAAAAILRRWQGRTREARDRFSQWTKAGGTCPIDLLNRALLAVREYPGALGEIGLHDPALRARATMEDAAARLTNATDESDFARQCEDEMNRALPVVKAWHVIEDGLRTAGVILSKAAADVADVTPAAVEAGLTALRSAYAPNPHGHGTASGVVYPDVNSALWPDCMSPRDWDKLGEPAKGDLIRLRDSMIALKHSSGQKAGKSVDVEQGEAELPDELMVADIAKMSKSRRKSWMNCVLAFESANGESEKEKWLSVADKVERVLMELHKKTLTIPECDYLTEAQAGHYMQSVARSKRPAFVKMLANNLRRDTQRKAEKANVTDWPARKAKKR